MYNRARTAKNCTWWNHICRLHCKYRRSSTRGILYSPICGRFCFLFSSVVRYFLFFLMLKCQIQVTVWLRQFCAGGLGSAVSSSSRSNGKGATGVSYIDSGYLFQSLMRLFQSPKLRHSDKSLKFKYTCFLKLNMHILVFWSFIVKRKMLSTLSNGTRGSNSCAFICIASSNDVFYWLFRG